MSDIVKILNAPKSVFSSIILGLAGIFMFLILPLFVGAISKELALSEQQIGYLASADLFGFFLGSVSSLWWARKVNWKTTGIIALLVIILANELSIIYATNISLFLGLRVLSGIGQGVAVSLYSAHVGDTLKPERYYANFLIGQTIVGVLGLFLLPQLIETIGGKGILYTQMGLCVVAFLAVILWLPKHGINRHTDYQTKQKWDWKAPVIGLLGLLLFFIAQGGTWAYMQRIGGSFELTPQFIGLSLSLAMIGAFLGSSTASVVATRYGRRLPLLIVGIGQPLCLLLIFSNLGNWSFLAGIMAFLFLWNLAVPYIMGVLVSVDASGKSILAANPMFALGVSIAPIIISQFVNGNQYTSVGWVGAVAMVLSVGLLLSALIKGKD